MAKVKQVMLSKEWAEQLLQAHINHTMKVRKGEKPAPVVTIDYGKDGPNPYGVGSSSLTKDARQWWYGRKHYKYNKTPTHYKFTAEQGRIMEIPVLLAMEEMGYKFEKSDEGQKEAKNKNHGGLVDEITIIDGEKVIVESKHLNKGRFLDIYSKPLIEASASYFWQSQSYMLGTGAAYTLFVISAQDASAVRSEITKTKNWKVPALPSHLVEPNPKVFGFKLYPIEDVSPMDKRAIAMMGTLDSDKPPARERNPYKDWECGVNFCEYRDQCLLDGPEGEEIYRLPEVEIEQVYMDKKVVYNTDTKEE